MVVKIIEFAHGCAALGGISYAMASCAQGLCVWVGGTHRLKKPCSLSLSPLSLSLLLARARTHTISLSLSLARSRSRSLSFSLSLSLSSFSLSRSLSISPLFLTTPPSSPQYLREGPCHRRLLCHAQHARQPLLAPFLSSPGREAVGRVAAPTLAAERGMASAWRPRGASQRSRSICHTPCRAALPPALMRCYGAGQRRSGCRLRAGFSGRLVPGARALALVVP